jgi:signal transduction histidine kinase
MKPAGIWTLFVLCLAVVVVAMAWSSIIVLRLERTEAQAQAQAVLEENCRLALWRMDSALTPLLAQESARPYFQYSAFYPAEGAYTGMFTESRPGSAVVPSPLLRDTPPRVVLHFQLAPDGQVTSPQAPRAPWRASAIRDGYADGSVLDGRETRLRELQERTRTAPALRAVANRWNTDHPRSASATPAATRAPTRPPRAAVSVAHAPTPTPTASPEPSPTEEPAQVADYSQRSRSMNEFKVRKQTSEYAANQVANLQQLKVAVPLPTPTPLAEAVPPQSGLNEADTVAPPPPVAAVATPAPGNVEEGALAPLWVGDALVLARPVHVNGRTYVQGPWLDWPGLREDLLSSIHDLLPEARLEPVSASNDAAAPDGERRLAALPIRLVAGAAPAPERSGLSPIRLSLLGAWACVLVAAGSVAALLYGVMALSERRRMFVSAVTHELRTPLTTFRLYTDMLGDGMVPSEERRGEYVQRLRTEAQRLGHLVENVLFYARLESGRAGAVRESIDLAEFARQGLPGLQERTTKVGLTIELRVADAPLRVQADRSALEQILVNLVDNACKYAAASNPPVLHVDVASAGGRATLRVRDHGPGLSPTERRRLFRPFSKSDREAAASAPGVGLGLALSRRLARAQGGDLRMDDGVKDGAAFVLTLPVLST